MNKDQIQLQKSIIHYNRERILQLEHELENPRIRNVTGRHNELRSLEFQIKQALFLLWQAGEITLENKND